MDRVVIIDATNNFMIASEGREKYDKRHIRGAFHIDLKMDMCRPVTKHGGRDPLPEDMNSFREKLEEFYKPWLDLKNRGTGVHCGECGCWKNTPHKVF